MNRWVRGAAWLVLGLSASAATAADEKDKGGWVSLFDGKTLSGWTALELRGQGTSHWDVKDGVIVGSGEPSMLFSPQGHYKNFRYRAEVKINDQGNSGMYVRTAKKASFTDGYEIQINSTHRDPIKTGSVYTMVHIYKQIVPPDTWFTQQVEVVDRNYRGQVVPHIKVWVNDELLYEYLDHTKSFRQGHFAFQQHDPGSRIEIRKVEVMELPESK